MAKPGRKFKKNATADSKRQRAYNARPEQRKNRALRVKARRMMIKAGKVKKGDGKDVGHKRALSKGGSDSASNLRVESKSANRAHGGRIGTHSLKGPRPGRKRAR